MYSHSTYILQNQKASKLIGSLTPQSIRAVLGLTKEFFQDSIPFNELDMMYLYKSYDPVKKDNFLKLILKPENNTQNLEYPCQISIFREEIQFVFSLLSQVLGLDHDHEVSEVMLGFLLSYYEAEMSQSSVIIALDQFISESMHN